MWSTQPVRRISWKREFEIDCPPTCLSWQSNHFPFRFRSGPDARRELPDLCGLRRRQAREQILQIIEWIEALGTIVSQFDARNYPYSVNPIRLTGPRKGANPRTRPVRRTLEIMGISSGRDGYVSRIHRKRFFSICGESVSGTRKLGKLRLPGLETHDFTGNQAGYHLGTGVVDTQSAHVWRGFLTHFVKEKSCKKNAVLYDRGHGIGKVASLARGAR